VVNDFNGDAAQKVVDEIVKGRYILAHVPGVTVDRTGQLGARPPKTLRL
jgi:hypothetical protein